MHISNFNWVCFECRTSRREPKLARRVPVCAECGADCFCLGYKVEVPRRYAVREWRKLRDECRRRYHIGRDSVRRWNIRRIHALEQEIIRRESMRENKDRSYLIKRLKDELVKRRSL
ncbi:hypothetical protein OJ996_23580 [Luteolibacter sp. GHJ8]|uniref:Uncharacterized protein n=1 Tax=Luteolibacter rhizosphaerae TaxID=2989719 RepID=A0ABT3GAS8_9BACT|nr:hypothetical protein [Luteolibacter rhizosphaerae]MCW1916589.1 hypothetical protein [Luteolibacter rhizosphaerae]